MGMSWLANCLLILRLCCVTSRDIRVGYSSARPNYGEATLTIGLDRIRAEGRLLDHNVSFHVRLATCSPVKAVAAHIELIQTDHVDVIMGNICSTVCIPTGYYDTYYNMPRLPMACTDVDLANKTVFPTLIRTRPAANKVGPAVEQVFLAYNWRRAAFLLSTSVLCLYPRDDIMDKFKDMNVTITDSFEINRYDYTKAQIRKYLAQIAERARIIIVCHDWAGLSTILDVAYELSMLSPEYVYLKYDMSPSNEMYTPWQDQADNLTGASMDQLKLKYSALKQLTFGSIDEAAIIGFDEERRNAFAKPPWNVNATSSLSFMPMFMADSAYLYFTIVSELIEDGLDYRDGRLVFDRARNREFHGWTGRVVMNDVAERDPDFWLLDCPPLANVCSPYADVTITDPPSLVEFEKAYWSTEDGLHPPDTPECGFKRELCQKSLLPTIVPPLVIVPLLFIILGALIYHKRQKDRERLLQMMAWKVKPEDIDLTDRSLGIGAISMQSMRSLASMARSTSSSVSAARSRKEQIFTKLGLYNGAVVAVKFVDKPQILMSRELLVEMKTLKDLVHENLNPFIGACTDPPSICVLSAYCPKGSLQDIIENDDIKLEWLFKSSLIRDLVNGMNYLKCTPFKSHGNLMSSNCLIDSRWVLKVSGFGLARFMQGQQRKDLSESKRFQKMLWTAPELLRLSDKERPMYGTEKGDVYSFGIILQEMVYRTMPFFENMQARDIVSRVKNGESVPYRPTPPDPIEVDPGPAQVIKLMIRCWAENPEDRPQFEEIKKIFKGITKGQNTNILDNMLSMLEQYANNLESLVQVRTGELLEEKKKTDMLLYRMLPSSVADRLKVGKSVEPEMYSSVTVYFSDIVGFTSLSSQSTPMEVVNLLNDLYTSFDDTINHYDVYKVETIGDAYMVVSGLPHRNGDQHAPEIADMALALLDMMPTFKIRHRPGMRIQLRIGIHTGPCAAGVVGLTMPRFCLFGDTVNMASRMESTGEAQKIQISEDTRSLMARLDRYLCEERGFTEVKGKGLIKTYWLTKAQKHRYNDSLAVQQSRPDLLTLSSNA